MDKTPGSLEELMVGLLDLHVCSEEPEHALQRACEQLGGIDLAEDDRLRAEEFFAGLIGGCVAGSFSKREVRGLLMQAVFSKGWLLEGESQIPPSSVKVEELPVDPAAPPPLRRPRSARAPPPSSSSSRGTQRPEAENQSRPSAPPQERPTPAEGLRKEEPCPAAPSTEESSTAAGLQDEKGGPAAQPQEGPSSAAGSEPSKPTSALEDWAGISAEINRVWDLANEAFDAEEALFSRIKRFAKRWGPDAEEAAREDLEEINNWMEDHRTVARLRADRASHYDNIRRRDEEAQRNGAKLPRPHYCFVCGHPGVKKSRKCPNFARHLRILRDREKKKK